MTDDMTQTGVEDSMRNDVNDKAELESLHLQFPDRSHQEIAEAIRVAGPMKEDVIKYLREKR